MDIVKLQEPVKVGRWHVMGWSRSLDQPMLSFDGDHLFTLDQIRRGAWEQGEPDAFTDVQLDVIRQLIDKLKKENVHA